MFSCEIYKIFKKTFFCRTVPVDISKTNCYVNKCALVVTRNMGCPVTICAIPSLWVLIFIWNETVIIGYLLHICSMFYIKLRKSEKHSPDFKGQSCKLYNSKYTIASTQITNSEIFAFVTVLIFKLLSRKVLFINRQDNKK